jgi:hypothetical protein
MKKFFGEYHYMINKAAKAWKAPREDVPMGACFAVEKNLTKIPTSFSTQEECLFFPIFLAEQRALKGEILHYFIESEALAEKLPGMIKGFNPQYLDALCEDAEADSEMTTKSASEKLYLGACQIAAGSTGSGEIRTKTAMLHTCGKKADGILFTITRGPAEGDFWMVHLRNKEGIHYWGRNEKETNSATTPLQQAVNLIFAMGLYVKCFPHALVEGFPETAKHPAHYKGQQCASVGTVPQIIERDGPSPHFRSGHFRVLNSPVFTKSRFKVIFIEDTFVKGRAKTVIDQEA